MMASEKVNQATRKEWRDLGFFYERDDESKEWRILGSRSGIGKFANILREYSQNPVNLKLSEHEHLGPYSYLEIGTWTEAVITDHWIAGRLPDIARLAALVEEQASSSSIGDRIDLRRYYAPDAPYDLVIEIREDNFDPAKADKACW